MKIAEARKLIGNKIIGISCNNSIKLAKVAIKNNADYLAFGAFNLSKTKKAIPIIWIIKSFFIFTKFKYGVLWK